MTGTRGPDTLVLDANGIIGTGKAGIFPLVRHLAARALIPVLVIREVTDTVSRAPLEQALTDWLSPLDPSGDSLALIPSSSSEPDRHVLALALDHMPCVVVSGDRGLANRAQRLGIDCIDAPTVVRVLAEEGIIPAAKPHLDRMKEQGFGIPDMLYQEILASLGEGPAEPP